jgi:hypothetical protein
MLPPTTALTSLTLDSSALVPTISTSRTAVKDGTSGKVRRSRKASLADKVIDG